MYRIRWKVPPRRWGDPGDRVFQIVEGCCDCPFLEVLPFGEVECRHTDLPVGLVLDPTAIQLPPRGCPLLDGGSVTVILRQAEYGCRTEVRLETEDC